MSRFFSISLLFFLTCGAFAQTASRPSSSSGRVIWEPPTWWNFLPKVPNGTISKEMLATLRVSGFPIALEETALRDVTASLGDTIGQMGDAGAYNLWSCFHGTSPDGRWALWLESGEIEGGRIGEFQWQRLSNGEVLDPRCQMLGGTSVELPITLRPGISEAEVLKSLGRPTGRRGDRLLYVHEHEESIRGEPFDSLNMVTILLRGGRVWAIEVSKTTTN